MKNWKTTVLGFAAGVLQLMANGFTLQSAAAATAMALLGAFAKDYDVSHTKP